MVFGLRIVCPENLELEVSKNLWEIPYVIRHTISLAYFLNSACLVTSALTPSSFNYDIVIVKWACYMQFLHWGLTSYVLATFIVIVLLGWHSAHCSNRRICLCIFVLIWDVASVKCRSHFPSCLLSSWRSPSLTKTKKVITINKHPGVKMLKCLLYLHYGLDYQMHV